MWAEVIGGTSSSASVAGSTRDDNARSTCHQTATSNPPPLQLAFPSLPEPQMAPKSSPSVAPSKQSPASTLRQRGQPAAAAAASPAAEPAQAPLHVQLQPQGDGQYRVHAPVRLLLQLSGYQQALLPAWLVWLPSMRVADAALPASLPQGTPLNELDLSKTFLAHTHASHHTPASFYTSRRFLFPLGLALGSFAAYFLLSPLDPDSFDAYSHRLSTLVDDVKTQVGGLPSFPELNNLSGLPSQVWKDLAGLVDTDSYSWMKNRDFEVGSSLAAEGLTAEFPVILVPGIISTGLESWGTAPAQRPWFRKRLWGSTSMIQAVLSDKKEWMRALSLDEQTGLDRPGYKVRAAQGFDAASQFIQVRVPTSPLVLGLCAGADSSPAVASARARRATGSGASAALAPPFDTCFVALRTF